MSQITEVPASSGAAQTGPFAHPKEMTVDGGDLYLADGEGREYSLDKFSASSGAFLSQFPQAPSSLGYLNQAVAVGHETGETEVYVTGDEVVGAPEGAVAVFDASGGFQGVWKGSDTPSGGFGCFECAGPAGVAVDESGSVGDWASGDVYVADTEHAVVDVFEPVAGGGEKYVTQITGPEPPTTLFATTFAVAVNQSNGEVLIADGEGGNPGKSVDVFKPGPLTGQYEFVGKLMGPPNGPFEGVEGIASDATTGNVFVAASNGEVDEFSSSNVYLGRIAGVETPAGSFNLRSVAVDPVAHRVFVADQVASGAVQRGVVDVFGPDLVIPDITTEPATGVAPESATLHGTVNPDGEGAATCEFEWGLTPEFGHTLPCSASVPDGSSPPITVQANVNGLQPDRTYFFRLQATNKNGTNQGEASQDQQFTTPGPGLDSESVSNVTSSSVSLDASINPHNTPTSYYFQYGTSTAYGTDVPVSPGIGIGSGEGDVEVAPEHVQGLSAATVYHYRVVAVSEMSPGTTGSFPGPDQTFVTQPAGGGLVLPDGRAWEMVTPPDKRGAQFSAIGDSGVIQAAVGGGAMTWLTDSPTEPEPQGYTNFVQGFSGRGADGWVSHDISVPHPAATGLSIGHGQEYRFFSEDLSRGIVQPFGEFIPSLSEEASEQTVYLATDYQTGDPVERSCSSSCFRPLVTSKSGFANVPAGTTFGGRAIFVGATPDLNHVMLHSDVALTSAPAPHGGLYEWSAGKLVLVSVLPGPGGEAANGPTLGSSNQPDANHAISDDGSRVFWAGEGGLFMRDLPREETLHLSESGEFEYASADGSKVFFDGQICEVKVSASTGELECSVTASIGGRLVGASEDGSWVYSVGSEVLAPGGMRGGNNLYVRHDGVTRFIAAVSEEDAKHLRDKVFTRKPVRVSPDGHWLAFMSQGELAGASTRDALTGVPDEEVYLYDAEANGGAGRLVCASCNPSGARPVGAKYFIVGTLWGGFQVWNEIQIASNIPGWTPYSLAEALYQSRYLSNSGRLFFNSNDGLVPQDVNGTWDVYEYEPPGVGDCGRSSATFSERSNGCVGLVSSGGSGEESGFLDASENGGDVFFLTSAKLAGQDYDTALDIYDAHECSPDAPCFAQPLVSPPVCDTGDACKAAPTPQPAVFGAPSSATFSGAGNVAVSASKSVVRPKGLTRAQKLARALRACRKKKSSKRRKVCVRQAKARYAARRAGVKASKRGRG